MKQYVLKSRGGKRLTKNPHIFRRPAESWLAKQKDRIIAVLLAGTMVLSLSSPLISHAVAAVFDPSLCDHHPVHTQACGYSEGAAGTPCAHIHDDSCGYIEGEEGACTHQHDGSCGYSEGTEGTPCAFTCPICHRSLYPSMDGDVSIQTPEGEENIVSAGEKLDLLSGVFLSVDREDAPGPEDYDLALFTVLDSETGEPVEPENGRYLTPEEGHSYLLVYAAYDSDDNLAAAAERTVTAVKVETLAEEARIGNPAVYNNYNTALNITATVDYANCAEWVTDNAIAHISLAESSVPDEGTIPAFCEANEYRYCGSVNLGFPVYALNATPEGEISNAIEAAQITLTITAADGGNIPGLETGSLMMLLVNNGSGLKRAAGSIAFEPAADGSGYTSVTIKTSKSDMAGCLVLVSAENMPHEGLAEDKTFTAYHNGTDDSNADTKFTVTMPAGTAFYTEDSDGNRTWLDPDTSLTLKVKRYQLNTPLDENDPSAGVFDFIGHRNLVDGHMQWHTGLYDQKASDSTNDGQFWRIWLEDGEGREVDIQLPQDKKATVVVEYLNENEALEGALGTRRTCVMDMGDPKIGVPEDMFINTEIFSLETSYHPNDIGKTNDRYTKITYYLSGGANGGSTWGNLVALCSMKLANTYVSFAEVTGVRDGLAALDDEEADGSDKPGNDSSAENRRVRTFDSIEYMLEATFATRGKTISTDSVVGMLQATLEMDVAKARFDTAALKTNYMVSNVADWQIVYYDADGTARYLEDPTGIWECDSNGKKSSNKTSLNDIVSGSSTKDGSAYSTEIVRQELTAYKDITFEGSSASPKSEFPLYINVMAAKEGDIIEPSFAISVKGNKDNFTSEQNDSGDYVVSDVSTANQYEIQKNGSNADKVVTVTAAPRYNVVIKQATDTAYSGYFNFTDGTGSDTRESANDVKGRLSAYGITVQLFNETNWKTETGGVDTTKLAAKGMMGIELPVDGITFDMQLFGYPAKGQDSYPENDLALILWDYQPSRTATQVQANGDRGEWGRNLYWKSSDVTRYAKGATVYNQAAKPNNRAVNEVYNGGTWSLTANGDGVGADGKTTGTTTGNGSATKYTFTIQGYDFDFDNFKTSFPDETAGNAGKLPWLSEGYVGSFSAGHIQVIQRMPDDINADASIYAKVTVADLVKYPDEDSNATHFEATSISGAEATSEAETSKARDGDTDGMGGTADDGKQSSVQVYAPGGISKHNSFTNREGLSISVKFLGTSYWDGPHYDASTYAGTDVYLWGGAQLGRSSDAVVSAYNLLQKFDSSKLEIDKAVSGNEQLLYTDVNRDGAWPAENWSSAMATVDGMTNMQLTAAAGTHTFLYAADPLYPKGWNADVPEEMQRMNSATERDLIYYDDLGKLEAAGYTCIGILLEVRNAEIPAGCYPGMRVAMKVKTELEDKDKTSTVNMIACTVNTARMWVRSKSESRNLLENVTWKNTIQNNPAPGSVGSGYKNSLGTVNGKDIWELYFGGPDETTGSVKDTFKAEYDETTTARYLTCGKNNGTNKKDQYNNFPYVKTAYNDGAQADGTHLGGYQAGMSLLILGYKASLGINVDNEMTNTSGNGTVFAPNQGQNTPLYTIDNITTTLSNAEGSAEDSVTNLVVSTFVVNASDPLEIVLGGYQVKTLKEDGAEEWINVSTDENQPTTVTIEIDGEMVTYTVYAAYGEGKLKFYLSGVPIGETLAPLRFYGQIGKEAKNNDSYTVRAGIQGDGDKRAFSIDKDGKLSDNQKEISINVSVTGGAALSKTVDTRYIDQNGSFTYTISYENTANQVMTGMLYMYDLLPYNGDSRRTYYTEIQPDPTQGSDALTVDSISGKLESTSGEDLRGSGTKVYQYYSTIMPSALEPLINFTTQHDGMDSSRMDGKDIDQLLRNAVIGNDARGLYYVVNRSEYEQAKAAGTLKDLKPQDIYTYDETGAVVTGVQEYVEYSVSETLGSISIKAGYENTYAFWNVRNDELVQAGEVIEAGDGVVNVGEELKLYKVFRWLGVIDPTSSGNNLNTGSVAGGVTGANHLKYATCLYGVAVGMAATSKLSMSVTMKTEGNEASNIYGNQAHAWVSGSNRAGKQASEQVTTYVVGREISGLVWEDLNQDGGRQTTEPLISGVTCTLLKWTGNGYEVVMGDGGPNGRNIRVTYIDDSGREVTEKIDDDMPVKLITGRDGKYRFFDLADGDYVVAFSGTPLAAYKGVTAYQKSGVDASVNNDGVKLAATPLAGLDGYDYYIRYSSASTGGSNIKLYTLTEMVTHSSVLRNNTQVMDYLDLGLVTDHYELPETGGMGTYFWTAGGLTLVWVSLSLAWIRRKKNQMWI